MFSKLPSVSEQNAIANYLDKKTEQIDELIGKKKELIQKLNEQRSALITHAVTKGLNDSIPMKDSGIAWLGEIPEQWDVRRIKECAVMISKGTTPSTEGREILQRGSVRFIKAENVAGGEIVDEPYCFIDEETNQILRRSILCAGDVLIVIAGATLGKTAVVQTQHLPANTNQAVAFIRPNAEVKATFITYWLKNHLFRELLCLYAVQSAQPNLAMGVLGNFIIPLPPIEEQQAIIDYLDEKTEKIDGLIRKTETAIQTLEEYRTALITAAVTGKIKVNND